MTEDLKPVSRSNCSSLSRTSRARVAAPLCEAGDGGVGAALAAQCDTFIDTSSELEYPNLQDVVGSIAGVDAAAASSAKRRTTSTSSLTMCGAENANHFSGSPRKISNASSSSTSAQIDFSLASSAPAGASSTTCTSITSNAMGAGAAAAHFISADGGLLDGGSSGDMSSGALFTGDDTDSNKSLLVQVTSLDRSWVVRRTYENFRFLDRQLHRCCYDRKFSQLQELPPEDSLHQHDREVSRATLPC